MWGGELVYKQVYGPLWSTRWIAERLRIRYCPTSVYKEQKKTNCKSRFERLKKQSTWNILCLVYSFHVHLNYLWTQVDSLQGTGRLHSQCSRPVLILWTATRANLNTGFSTIYKKLSFFPTTGSEPSCPPPLSVVKRGRH